MLNLYRNNRLQVAYHVQPHVQMLYNFDYPDGLRLYAILQQQCFCCWTGGQLQYTQQSPEFGFNTASHFSHSWKY